MKPHMFAFDVLNYTSIIFYLLRSRPMSILGMFERWGRLES